jgi:hypothetical protein
MPGAWVFLEQRYPTLDVVGVSQLALDAEVSAQESHRRFRDQLLGCISLRDEAVLQVAVETALSRRLRTCDLFGGPVAACENVRNIDKVAEYFDSVAFTRDFAGVTLRVKRDPIQGVNFPAQSRAFAGRRAGSRLEAYSQSSATVVATPGIEAGLLAHVPFALAEWAFQVARHKQRSLGRNAEAMLKLLDIT